MRRTRPLDALFPRTRQGILAATLMRPGKAWYVSELAQWMGVPSSSLQRELQSLANAAILRTHRQGRMVYYQANKGSPLFSELHGLLLKTAGLVDILSNALKPLTARLRLVFVYGSIASGNERSDSDIDLMVVGTVSPVELALPLRRARESLGREINPTVYTPVEFDKKRAARDHFLTHVLDNAKVFVLGNRHELDKVAQGRRRKARSAE
jgi:predicted nucleotidyltransferase